MVDAAEPVQVATFTTVFEAEAARAMLEENDIEALVLENDAGGALPPLAMTTGARLLVRAEDAAAALDLLEQPPT